MRWTDPLQATPLLLPMTVFRLVPHNMACDHAPGTSSSRRMPPGPFLAFLCSVCQVCFVFDVDTKICHCEVDCNVLSTTTQHFLLLHASFSCFACSVCHVC
jgi:hypothetical protein